MSFITHFLRNSLNESNDCMAFGDDFLCITIVYSAIFTPGPVRGTKDNLYTHVIVCVYQRLTKRMH